MTSMTDSADDRLAIGRIWRWLRAAPDYPASEADRHEIDVVGLRLPWRATLALTVVTFVLLLDYSRTFVSDDVVALGRAPEAMRVTAVERVLLWGLLPLLVVLFVFRDRPSKYGLRVGDWRAGLPLMLLGCAAMTPVVLWFTTDASVAAYYAVSAEPLPSLALTNALDLTASEFLFRGFLMLTVVRAIGPLGVLISTMPFVFAHLGKPELELFSTLGGGLVYGWLAWRTSSIVWGAIGHIYILTLVTLAATR